MVAVHYIEKRVGGEELLLARLGQAVCPEMVPTPKAWECFGVNAFR